MTNQIKRGVYVTMITPYNTDGSVDYGAVEALVEFYALNGCDGIFAACQSSEIFYLSEDERVQLTKTVVNKAARIKNVHGSKMSIVASGHISENIDSQIRELNRIADTSPDGLVLISNRMDISNISDDNWIAHTELLIYNLPDNIPIGVYECPYPQKRLMTENMIKWCLKTERFAFIKDTCCNSEMIKNRLDIIRGTNLGLYNANAQTLLESLKYGGAGYCGVMANFHPQLYRYLYDGFINDYPDVETTQALACITAFTESLAYPVTAKYHLSELENIDMTTYSRSRDANQLTNYQKSCIKQMKILVDQYLSKTR